MKTCPFCKSKDLFVSLVDFAFNDHRITCRNCGAMGPSAGTNEDAERYWNEREPEPVEYYHDPAWDDDPYVVGTTTGSILPGLLIFWLSVGFLIFFLIQWLNR